MGNSMSHQGQAAHGQDAEALQGPARLPLDLKHAMSAHAAAEAPAASTNPTSSSSNALSSTQSTKQVPAAAYEQAQSENARHPAFSLSSSSSRSSSIVSLNSRGFTNDDTMPWRGSPHGSHDSMPDLVDAKSDAKSDKSEAHVDECEDTFVDIPDEERCLQCSLQLPAAGASSSSSSSTSSSSGMRLVANRSVHVGQLFMHPKRGTASAEQVVWALPQQQLLSALQQHSTHHGSNAAAAAAAAAPDMQLVSPPFVLPCPAVGDSSSSSAGKNVVAAQHVQTEWCLVLHPTPSAKARHGAPQNGHNSTSTLTSTLTSSSSSSSRPWQLSLRANWSTATLPNASSLTQKQQQKQQKVAPAGPASNPAQSQLGSSSSGTSTPVAAMHGWQLHCAGRVELMAPACRSGAEAAAAAAGTASSARLASDFQLLLQHSNQEAVLPFTICSDSVKATITNGSSSSTSSKTRTSDSFADRTLKQTSSSNSGSDTKRTRDQSRQAGAAAAVSSNADVSADNSETAGEAKCESSDQVLPVLLTFKQLQLLPAASVTTGTSGDSDCTQAQQQQQQASRPVHSTSSGDTCSQENLSFEPHQDNTQETAGSIAGPHVSSSSSGSRTLSEPPASPVTESLQQLNIGSSTQNTSAAAAAAAAETAAATPADLPAAAAAAPVIERRLEAVLLSTAPRLLVVDDFFDAGLCEGLMDLANDKLVRSRVASGSETPSRTSWSHFFVKEGAKHPLVAAAEGQIEALFGCPALRGPHQPLAKIEALQVIKYHKGEFYHEHYDNRADSPLTRAATIIIYLCDTESGGATSFPRAVLAGQASGSYAAAPAGSAAALPGFSGSPGFGVRGGSCAGQGLGCGDGWRLPPKVTIGARGVGIKVHPVQGRAVVFWSKRPDGNEDPNSIHAADTVERGHKWIITRWMKDDPQ